MNKELTSESPLLEMIGIKKVFKATESELNVLNNLDITIHKGDFISIQGASGIGKSTLLYIMGLLDIPSSGEV